MKRNYILWPIVAFLVLACQPKTNPDEHSVAEGLHTISGETMGTYYRVSYMGQEVKNLQNQLDSLLQELDVQLSTYNPASVIAKINAGEDLAEIKTQQRIHHFLANFKLAKEIHQKTNGYFDPTVMPLVNYWGFGYNPEAMTEKVDSSKVDSIRQLVGFNKISLNAEQQLSKNNVAIEIDFSAIAKGYGVDQLGLFLMNKGIVNYLIDIGGEVRARGNKSEGKTWVIGIARPTETAAPSDYMAAIAIENAAVATSGNYRNYHEIEGTKYSHTINPFTGYPERSHLLSASIKAIDCATADAIATACMVAGLDKALQMVDALPGIEGYFIYSNGTGALFTRATKGFPEEVE